MTISLLSPLNDVATEYIPAPRDGQTDGYTGAMRAVAPLLALLLLQDALPGSGPVTRIIADSKGRTWVGEEPFVDVGEKADLDAIPKLDVSKAYADRARALRVGKLVAVDAGGRLWLQVADDRLWAYDGKEWLARRTSDGRGGDAPRSAFTGRSVEIGGALWFPDDLGVHRFDGKEWSVFTVTAKPAALDLVLDAEGRPWLWSRDTVRRFDGKAFVEVRKLPALPIGGVCPVGAGVFIVHEGGVFTWPADEERDPPAPADPKSLPEWIEGLNAVDVATRLKSAHGIAQLGKDALAPLKEAFEKETHETRKKRLERMINEINEPRGRRVQLGAFYLERMQFLWRTRLAAYVVGLTEGQLGRERALLRVTAAGITRLSECEEALTEHLATTLPNVCTHEELDGTLWISRHKTGLWQFDGKALKRVPGASEEGSYEYLGTDAKGALWWRQVYATKRLLRVFEGTAEVVKGR